MSSIVDLTATQIAAGLRNGDFSAIEVAQAFLDRIGRVDPRVNAFLSVEAERTLEQAAQAQAMLDRGEGGPLTGVPVALKDNLSTQGVRTTCASRILEDYVPPYDAHVVQRLAEQCSPSLGKTNLDEFAMGTSCEKSAFGVTRNPYDLERVPGGSSGGSAAAVAGRMAPLALGSDTGGSVRMPAALCGVVGFKPTYGRVSRYGLVAFGSSLDQIGPFARTVEDAALLAQAISGPDRRDDTSLPDAPISTDELKSASLKGKRFGIPQEMMGEGVADGVRSSLEDAAATLRSEGATVETISLPSTRFGVSTYYIIAPAEASSNLARFDGVRYGPRIEATGHIGTVAATRGELFGHEVKSRIMVGTYALSAGYYDAYYLRAQQVRGMMSDEYATALKSFDAILGPGSPVPAFKLRAHDDDPMALKVLDFCTIPANLGGFPGISVPCGDADGLPIGLGLTGRVQGDEDLLALAYAVERCMPTMPRPPLD